jgi:hypothetical protein
MWTRYGLNLYFCKMATIKFYLQSDKNPSGIYVRLREGRNIDAKAKTNFLINPNDWDKQKGGLKNKKTEDGKKLNEDLLNLANSLLIHYNRSIGKIQIDSNWLKEFINPSEEKGAIPNKLINYFEYYAKHKESDVKASTLTKVNVNKHLLERFQKDRNREYLIKDINADFKIEFEKFCKKNAYSQNTIARTVRYIKTVCYHARNNGIETHFQLDSISAKNEKIDIIFLTEEEIEQVSIIDYELDHLNNARDWLIVCCETAQRVSDFMRFTKEMIRKDGDDFFIDFTQQKTGNEMSAFITPRLSDLLESNCGDFPRKISSAKMNKYIKVICEKAGLTHKVKGGKLNAETNRKENGFFPKWQLVTTKIGRKSFASNYFGKLPNALIMAQTGHDTESSFLLYVGKSQMSMSKQLAEGIRNLNKK